MAFSSIEVAQRIEENVKNVIIGKDSLVRLAVVTLLARGHLLLDDVPGVGKTVLAKTIAGSLKALFKRIQFTPDLLPADITGVAFFNQKTGEFTFRPGPIFAEVLLADEINRATPRTQAALLECMEERQVTAEGETRPLGALFFVVATQNPIEQHGTYPLPEAQLDRFLMRLGVGYPQHEEEVRILEAQIERHPLEDLRAVAASQDVLRAQDDVKRIHVARVVTEYIVKLVAQTRASPHCVLGASPRASLAVRRAAQAFALLDGSQQVTPQHVKSVFGAVVAHRLILRPEAKLSGLRPDKVIEETLQRVEVPYA
jgi:MoxR-like ATPase